MDKTNVNALVQSTERPLHLIYKKFPSKKVNAFAFLVKKSDNEASRAAYFRKIRDKNLSEILSW